MGFNPVEQAHNKPVKKWDKKFKDVVLRMQRAESDRTASILNAIIVIHVFVEFYHVLFFTTLLWFIDFIYIVLLNMVVHDMILSFTIFVCVMYAYILGPTILPTPWFLLSSMIPLFLLLFPCMKLYLKCYI
jgi:hypothetical protein